MSETPADGRPYGPDLPSTPDPPISAERVGSDEQKFDELGIGDRIRQWAPVGTFLVLLSSAIGSGGCYLTNLVTDRLDDIQIQIERVEEHVDERIDQIEDSIDQRLDELEDAIDERLDELVQRLVRVETTVESNRQDNRPDRPNDAQE